MKKLIIIAVIVLSLGLNFYLIGSIHLTNTYTPSVDDLDILGEMTTMVLETEQYKEIASREHVYSIVPGVSRFNVASPASVYSYEVHVKTAEQTYVFNCLDDQCGSVSNEGWTYSRYSEHKPILPLEKE